jgi:hypothetical protein
VKRAISKPKQNTDSLAALIGDNDIQSGIVVEITDSYRRRIIASWISLLVVKRTIPIPKQDTDMLAFL